MKKLILIILLTTMTSCSMTPQQRQNWQNFGLAADGVFRATGAVANVAGAYAQVQNSRSIRRISKKNKSRGITQWDRNQNRRRMPVVTPNRRRPYVTPPIKPIQMAPNPWKRPRETNCTTNSFSHGSLSTRCTSY